ncbi:MAG: ABC-F family ATP-binding cassette domain-containing protein [Candidatus Limisoma sp.]|nr:ABC-F family ATP-binding cassette domain-containing protein [Candidatus Limisoma sp.]
MKSYVQIEGLTKSYGDRLLFGDVTLGVYEGDKIGIIAKNGAGKTTFLRCVAGLEQYDSGTVTFRNGLKVAMLEQQPTFEPTSTVVEACLSNAGEAACAISAYEKATLSGDSEALAAAISQMDATRAWDYEERVKQTLTQLRITNFLQPVGELSGGQVKRLAIAGIVLAEPDLILLDEPTNHLDIEIIEWLEDYLKRSRATLLMVTHDRYFLDRVCNSILEIDQHEVFTYAGNYDYYLAKRQERLNAQNAELARVRNLLRTELDWMRRQPQARAGKAKYRIDAFYELDRRSRVQRDDRTVRLENSSSRIGNKIFEAVDVCKSFDNRVILDNFNYVFARYEKVGIVGANGVGKTTFVRLLQGELSPDSGYFDVGETVKFGYYSQEGIKFNESDKVIDAVRRVAEVVVFDERTRYTASQFLQMFLFTPETQQNYIAKLSGGERRRLYLATVLMRNPNFLILDEPTNDLDIVTLTVLEDYLQKFKGCLIIISHDRFFMDRTVDHLFVFEGEGRVLDFPGNYSDYREWSTARKAAEAAKVRVETPQQPKRQQTQSNRKTFKERMEFEQLTDEIARLEAEKADIETLLSSGELTDYREITEKSERVEQITARLDEAEMRWLELSEKD